MDLAVLFKRFGSSCFNTLSTFQANLFTIDIQNACLKEPWLGEIQYSEKETKTFPVCVYALLGSVMCGLLLCSVMA